MSLAIMNDTTKVDDQERLCREVAARLGWQPAEVYKDNSKSAWAKNRKRPGWDKMLHDVEAGRIGAIVVYHGDRLIRQPYDLEKLLQLADGKGIRLAAPTGTRDFDNPDDRYIMRIEAAGHCRESDSTSRRRKAQYQRMRREGRTRPGGRGGRALGYESDGMTIVPAEAGIIREMATRILAGETPGPICADLTARGYTTPGGFAIRHHTVKDALTRPRTAGLMPDGESAAAWEPILDRQTWEQVRLVLETRKITRFPNATNVRRHLLSGIALCGVCGGTLTAAYMRRVVARDLEAQLAYSCKQPGCRKIARKAEHVDDYVSARVVHLLNDPRQPEGTRPVRPGDAPEWTVLARERAETEAQVRDYSASAGRVSLLMARLDQIDARMAELREREARDSRSQLLARYRGITLEQFEAEPLGVRRALVAASYRITVLPASTRGRGGFRTEDVRLDPA